MSKLLEKIVIKQLNEHFDGHNLREQLQSAYQAGQGIETALVKVFNDCLVLMDKKRIILLILLDLSAAFDTIDHNVMLLRLEELFGINGSALEWLRSYFKNRFQKVVINGASSSPVELTTGVPKVLLLVQDCFLHTHGPLGPLR